MKVVLVVDDDVVARMVLMHLVDGCGKYEICEAEDGEDAWRQFEGGLRPAITFCDLRMPRLSGMELLGRVKGDPRFSSMPFVLVSAANDSATLHEADDLGAAGYIVKPFDAGQVRSHLDALAAPPPGADDAAATARRLGIDAQRLVLYLGGLHEQIVAAGPDIEQRLACADLPAARAQLARLREGCAMLGLAGAARAIAVLEALDGPHLDAATVAHALEEARRAALRQGESARTLPADA